MSPLAAALAGMSQAAFAETQADAGRCATLRHALSVMSFADADGTGAAATAIDWDAQPRELNQGYVHSCLEATLYASPVRSLVFLLILERSSPEPFFRLPPSLHVRRRSATSHCARNASCLALASPSIGASAPTSA